MRALQWVAANDLSGPPGKAVYTQLCNERGGIEADVTVLHIEDDRFMLVTGAGFGVRDGAWVARHIPPGSDVSICEVTEALATINLCGPLARTVLQQVADDDVGDAALPFRGVRHMTVGGARLLAVRIGYVGELGYEFYVRWDDSAAVYDRLAEAGSPYGIRNAGYRTIDSCRLEKGYLYWSGDIGPDYNPYEAGLGFCVALDKGVFIGREALERIRAAGPARRLCSLTLDGFAPLHGGEPVLHNGRVVSATTSCGYGYTLERTIAFAYLPSAIAGEAAFEIEAFGVSHAATRGPRCLYDAKMERLTG